MTTKIEHLKTLSIYAPPAVTRQAYQNPNWQPGGTWRYFYAAVVVVKLVGVVPLTEKLCAPEGQEAEELTAVFNQLFETLIIPAETHGGQVVKLDGSGLTLAWPAAQENLAEAVYRATGAAFAMRTALMTIDPVKTSPGEFELSTKIGISAGRVLEAHTGGVFGRWEYVLAGQPSVNANRAENLAKAGQIVIDEVAWQLVSGRTALASAPDQTLEPHLLGQSIAPGFYQLTDLQSSLVPEALPALDWSQLDPVQVSKVAATLRSYIPGAISNLLESGRTEMPAEIRPMTICFLELAGIDYADDPEAGARLNHFVRDAQEIIYRYEGSLSSVAVDDNGSVLLVLFGAPPFSHEDDEIRAVACALGLSKVAARHQLTVRAGLAAGPVLAGPLGAPQRREYTVIGSAVNLAAQLMQQAGPKELWLDQSVQSKAERFFEWKELGSLTIGNRTEPQHIYRAIQEKEQDQQESSAKYLLTELTGRDKELEQIDLLADRVWEGYGQVLLLSGEAGVGKSRLADEIVRRWLDRGGVPHTGDCVSYGRNTPYLPWRGILSSVVGLSPRLSLEQRITRLENVLNRLPLPSLRSGTSVPQEYWLQRLPLLAGILGLEREDTNLTRNLSETLRRDNIFATIRAIILEEARQRPTLVLLEDIHWSDELSLELAVDLAAEMIDSPIFLVLVHRPLSSPTPVPYQRLQNMSCTARIFVNELDPTASLKLVQNKLGVSKLPPDLADLILSKGQGNPFFTEELVNALQDLNVIEVEDGVCRLTGDLSQLELPDTVQKVVLARIDRLNEEEKMTLKVAAVIGRSFQLDLLAAVHPWTSSINLKEHLAYLQAEDFTRQEEGQSDPDFLFKHVITQEVAYETMLYAQRSQLHTTIGITLESRYGSNEGEIIDLLAYHYSRSDDRQKALKYLQKAGQKALKGHANEAAISYFTEALDVAREIDNVKVLYDLLAGREQAHDRLGNRAAQAENLAEMKRLAKAVDNQEQLIETGDRRIRLNTNLGEYHTAIKIAKESLALLRQHQTSVWEARILTSMGITCWRQGDYDQARDCMLAALKSEGAEGDLQLKATCLNYLGLINIQIAEFEHAFSDFQNALELYRAIGDRGGEAGCANNIGLLETSLGRYEQAQQYYQRALTICHTIGDRLREGISLNTLGHVNAVLGNVELSKEQLAHSLSIKQAIGDRRGEAFSLHDLGYLYLKLGHPGEAVSMFRSACNLRGELGETGNYVASLTGLCEASLTEGDVVTGEQVINEAITLIEQGSGSGEYPIQHVWWVYSQICRIFGRAEEADEALRQAYQHVKAIADRINDPDLKHSFLTNVYTNAAVMDDMASDE